MREGLVSLLLLCCSMYVRAQQQVDTTLEVKTVVITGQYVPTDSRATVNLVRTIDQETIKRRAANNLEELLNTDLMIRMSADGILGSAARLNGIDGENLKILIDGVPIVGRLNGNVDLGQINLQAVRQVEIIDGAQSLIYGSNASAGVINIITQRTQAHPLEVGAQTQLESNGFQTHQVRAGFQKGKWSILTNGTDLTFAPDTDSLRSQFWNPKRQRSARTSIRYKSSDALDIRLSGSHLAETVDNLGEIKRPTFRPYAFDDIYRTRRSDLNLHTEGWLMKRQYFYQFTNGVNDFYRIKNSYRYDLESDTSALLGDQQDTSRATGFLNRFTIASDYKNKTINWLAGAERFQERAQGLRFQDTTSSEPGRVQNTDLGLFASLKWKPLDVLTLQGGARYTFNQNYGRVVTPSVWLAYLPNPRTQVRFTYARGFRTPGMKELYFRFIDVNHYIVGNPSLNPEYSHNLRLDIKRGLITRSHYQISATVQGYYNRVRDRIALAEIGPVRYTYLNISEFRNAGYGLNISGNFWQDRVIVQTGFTHFGIYNQMFDAEQPQTGKELNWTFDWTNNVTFNLLSDKLNLNLWHKRTGETIQVIRSGLLPSESILPAWSLLNTSVGTQLWKNRLRLQLGVKNILNVRTLDGVASGGAHTPTGSVTPVHWGRTFFLFVGVDLAR